MRCNQCILWCIFRYGQMTAGSYCYIGPQGIVHGTMVCKTKPTKHTHNHTQVFSHTNKDYNMEITLWLNTQTSKTYKTCFKSEQWLVYIVPLGSSYCFIYLFSCVFLCSWPCWTPAGGTWALMTWGVVSLWPLAWGVWVELRLKLPSLPVVLV